jgi:hypothetical protein
MLPLLFQSCGIGHWFLRFVPGKESNALGFIGTQRLARSTSDLYRIL